jgi:hypothetical protein
MGASIGMVCNFYQERHALAGLIESASQFFDELTFMDAGPDGKPSDDGSLDILRSWGLTWTQANIYEGFGVIRTRLIHSNKCDWNMILDADERFVPVIPIFDCEGSEKYPDTKTPNLNCTVINPAFNQGVRLRNIIDNECEGIDAIRTCRRHWFDFGFKKPCQNWKEIPDFQLRIVRNVEHVAYDPKVKMHERLIDTRSGGEPAWFSGDQSRGPFHDHFHCALKPREPSQNAEDMEIYKKLDEERTKGMWLEHADMK